MFTVQFPNLGRWQWVVVRDAKTALEAEHTVRGRFRLGPYATITVTPGATPGIEQIGVHNSTRSELRLAAFLVGAFFFVAVVAGILKAVLF